MNATGSFLVGVVLVLGERGALPSEARSFLAVGVLGGYTTFSSATQPCGSSPPETREAYS